MTAKYVAASKNHVRENNSICFDVEKEKTNL